MDKPLTVPPGLKIFTAETLPDAEGACYVVLFLAKDFDEAKVTCERCGLNTDEKTYGELRMSGELTPDGTLTTWKNPNLGDKPEPPNITSP